MAFVTPSTTGNPKRGGLPSSAKRASVPKAHNASRAKQAAIAAPLASRHPVAVKDDGDEGGHGVDAPMLLEGDGIASQGDVSDDDFQRPPKRAKPEAAARLTLSSSDIRRQAASGVQQQPTVTRPVVGSRGAGSGSSLSVGSVKSAGRQLTLRQFFSTV